VDLKEPANVGKSTDSRFLKKILTNAEIEFIQNVENPDAVLWSLWACKETAYKVIKKTFPETAFLPRQWPVTFTNTKSEYSDGEITVPGKGKVFIRLFSNSQYVHCVGAYNITVLDKLNYNVEALPEEEGINASFFLRRFLAQSLAKNLSLNFHDIKIKRIRENGELQPPRVYIRGKKTDIDISLSHDGRFVAYVASQAEWDSFQSRCGGIG
jgi:phosphopantetheinyl transferase (holo-ACP synthase)